MAKLKLKLKDRTWQDWDGLLHKEMGEYVMEVTITGTVFDSHKWYLSGRYLIRSGVCNTEALAIAAAEAALLEEIGKIVEVKE